MQKNYSTTAYCSFIPSIAFSVTGVAGETRIDKLKSKAETLARPSLVAGNLTRLALGAVYYYDSPVLCYF